MSTGRIYKLAGLEALLTAECDVVLPPLRVAGELREIVTRHAEARGESLSAFLRRAMVRTVHADGLRAEAIRVRAIGERELEEERERTRKAYERMMAERTDAQPEGIAQ